MRKLLCVLFLAGISITGFGQNRAFIDSCLAVAPSLSDTDKVNTYIDVSYEYQSVDLDSALWCSYQALNVAQDMQWQEGTFEAENCLGNNFKVMSNFDSSFYHYDRAFEIARQADDTLLLAKAMVGKSNLYSDFARYNESAPLLKKAIQLFEQFDDQESLAKAYNNLGILLYSQGKLDEAVETVIKALHSYEVLGNENGYASTANNLSIFLMKNFRYEEALDYSSKALAIHRKHKDRNNAGYSLSSMAKIENRLKRYNDAEKHALEAIEIFEDLQFKQGVLANYNTVSLVYINEKRFAEAKDILEAQLALSREIDHIAGMANSCIELGTVYFELKDTVAAISHLDSVEKYMRTGGIDLELQADYYQIRSEIEAAIGNHEVAYNAQLEYQVLRDSLLNENSSDQANEMLVKYETEKAKREKVEEEQKNERLSYENELQKNKIKEEKLERAKLRNLLIFGGAALLLFVLLVLLRVRYKQRVELAEVKQEQERLRFKAMIDSEEKERTRIARELHDGIGQLLATARLNVAALEESVPEDDQSILSNSMNLIDSAVTEVRHISHNMMPTSLMELGLQSALNELGEQIGKSGAITFDFDFEIAEKLDSQVEVAVYRICQEVFSNMVKYAEATKIQLSAKTNGNFLVVKIADNGKGFDTALIEKSEGIGWKNIHSRAHLLRGEVEVQSAIDQGTTINLQIPV